MTLEYPDVSNFQAGLSLTGAVAAMAKASEGTGFRDPYYAGFKSQATALGIPFSAYHYQREGDPTGQAAYAHGIVGSTPLMLDVELGGAEGSWPSLTEVYQFIDSYRAGGGVLGTAYIPHWFWQGYWGSPSLTGLTQRGVGLISSNYTTYSDGGPGWQPYGGVTPVIWQFSSTYPFNGYAVDMNAFKGTVAQLAAVFSGKPTQEDDMLYAVSAPNDPGIWLSNGVWRRPLGTQPEAQWWLDHGAVRLANVDLSWFGIPVKVYPPTCPPCPECPPAPPNGGLVEHVHGITGGTGPAVPSS